MLSLNLLPYQQAAKDYILEHPSAGLFIDMGLGKTAATLSALLHLLTDTAEYRKVLIIGPKRVVEHTWPDEIRKWKQLASIPFSVVTGTVKQRLAALESPAPLHLLSRDNLAWLPKELAKQYDILVIDESSSFKTPTRQRFKALKKILPLYKRKIILTGTPAPNGLMDLWSQLYILDEGRSLGRTITEYRNNYFDLNMYGGFPDYKLKPGADTTILDQASKTCMSMKQEDYLVLPDLIDIPISVKLPPQTTAHYNTLKHDMILQLQSKETPEIITALNAGVLAGKLLQFCGGYVYNEYKQPIKVHDAKMEVLADLFQTAQVEDEQLLVYYAYQSERDAIIYNFPEAVDIRVPGALELWNEHKAPILLAHPASAGHGLNLQHGGRTIVWYNMTYDLELYQQANKRLHRMGQDKPVRLYHLLTNGIDSHVYNSVLTGKAALASVVMEELKYSTN